MKLLTKLVKMLKFPFLYIGRIINNDKNIYLIYTMGKVGSSTIYNSIKKQKPFSNIFHIHYLSKNYLENILPKKHIKFHHNITLGNKFLKYLKNNPNKRLKIITLTREPISRSISDLFQNWEAIYKDIEKVPNHELKSHIESLDHKFALQWFDDEFKQYLDFDIYKHEFNKNKGFEIYNCEKYDILVIKLEKLNTVFTEALSEFIGENIQMVRENTSENKKGSDKYEYLKTNVKIKENLIEKIYSSLYVRHFYSQDEIEGFKQKWT